MLSKTGAHKVFYLLSSKINPNDQTRMTSLIFLTSLNTPLLKNTQLSIKEPMNRDSILVVLSRGISSRVKVVPKIKMKDNLKARKK